MLTRHLSHFAGLAVATAFAFGTFGSAHAQQKTQAERRAKQEVFFNAGDEPPSMDPTKQVDAVSGMWLGHIYEGLMTYDKNNNVVPGTAEKMEVSADGKTYTFTIRKNAKWHDGKPVTAHDFEFAWKRLVDPAYASEYSFIAETAQLENAGDIIAKKKQSSELGVKATSDHTLQVKLATAVPYFPSMMAFQSFFPVRKDLVEKHGDKFSTNLESVVGNGPFKLTRWVKENSMRVEKAPTYWNASAIKITAIEAPTIIKDNGSAYNVFLTGGIDQTGLDSERLKQAQKDKLQIRTYNDGAVFYFEANVRDGRLFSNKKMRQALKLAINRREYVNKIVAIPGNKPAFGIVPDYMPGSKAGTSYRKEVPLSWKDGDIEGARKLMKEYLAETKQTKLPSFSILSGDSTVAKQDSEYFQNYLSKVFQTDVKVESVPFKTRLQKSRDGQFDLAMSGWGPDYRDPMTFMDLFTSKNDNNHTGWANAEYDALIAKAQATGDMSERIKIFAQAEKLLMDESPVIPQYQRARAYLLADGLNGVVRRVFGADPDYRFASWQQASAKKK